MERPGPIACPQTAVRCQPNAKRLRISNGSFGPDEIQVMTAAYEAALIDLAVTNRDDPITELIAKAVVNITATGEAYLTVTKERALNALGVRRPAV